MKVSSLLKAFFVLATMKTKIGAFANNVEPVESSQSAEQILGHDSLNNKENVLNIQDDFPVYENFQVLTQEKTVYVTLTPTTVYVTVTKTVGTTTTVYPNTHAPIIVNSSVASKGFNSPSKEVVSTSVLVVTTETAVVTSLTTTTATPDTTTAILTTTAGIEEEEDSASEVFTTTKGELDMVLGDRRKYLELLNSTTSYETVPKTSLGAPESTVPVYGTASSVVPQSETDDVQVPTPTNSLALTLSTLPAETFFSETSSTVASPLLSAVSSSVAFPASSSSTFVASTSVLTSFYPVNSLIVNHNSTAPTNSSDASHQNATGLEQLLRNFSPYTDLPSADYEYSNGGNSIGGSIALQRLLTVFVAIVSLIG